MYRVNQLVVGLTLLISHLTMAENPVIPGAGPVRMAQPGDIEKPKGERVLREDTGPELRQGDVQFIEAMSERGTPASAQVLRTFLDTGTTESQIGGVQRTLTCNRERTPDYCDKLIAKVCEVANQHRQRYVQNPDPAAGLERVFGNTVLDPFMMHPEDAKAHFHQIADQELATSVEHRTASRQLKNEFDLQAALFTPDDRRNLGALAQRLLLLRRQIQGANERLEFALDNGLPKEEPTANLSALRSSFNLVQHDTQSLMMKAFGRLSALGVAVSKDGRVYASMDLAVPNGPTGRVVFQLGTSANHDIPNPSIRLVAIEPKMKLKFPRKNLGPRFACTLGANGVTELPTEIEYSATRTTFETLAGTGQAEDFRIISAENPSLFGFRQVHPGMPTNTMFLTHQDFFSYTPHSEHFALVDNAEGAGYHPATLLPFVAKIGEEKEINDPRANQARNAMGQGRHQ